MAINEIQAKNALQKSNIPGASYVINPYTGCVHGCVYCYARFMKRFSGHSEPWGTFLDAKINAPEILRKQLERRKKPLKETVFLSSVTDPYIPAEKKYKLTRAVLEVLLEYQVPISILTKSDLVLRDCDLLSQFEQCEVGLSMMTVNDEIARQFEPHAPSPSQRIQTLKILKKHGIMTYAFISPYLPHLSDIEALLNSLVDFIDEVGVEALNVKGGNWTAVAQVLEQFHPKLLPGYKQLVKDDLYWNQHEEQTRHLASALHLSFMGFFRH